MHDVDAGAGAREAYTNQIKGLWQLRKILTFWQLFDTAAVEKVVVVGKLHNKI